MLNLIIFGPPGCGKGTQSARISCRFQLVHLSTGDIFRKKVKQGTELGMLLSKYMNNGDLVPDGIVLREIYQWAPVEQDIPGIVFDGFPRTIMQAVTLDLLLEKRDLSLDIVFCMKVDEDELFSRLIGRGEDSGRTDDNRETIEKRIKVYQQFTRPVKDYYLKQNKVVEISGMAPVKTVSERLSNVIEYYKMHGHIPE